MKVLVLSTNTGGGHNAAANALLEAFAERGVEGRMVDSVGLASPWASKTVSGVYMSVARISPKFFGASYRAAARMSSPHVRSVSYALNYLKVSNIEEYINAYAPDAILTTHVFCSQALTHLVKHGRVKAYTVGVMTDYNRTLYWDETRLDAYILPHPDLIPAYIALGMKPSTMHPFGIPVSPKLAGERDIEAMKREYGLDPEKKHVVVAGGSMGSGKLPKTVQALNEILPENVTISVVCGNNKRALATLSSFASPRVRVMGYVKPLNRFMASADAVVSKAGGLTSTECMAMRVPFIALHSIPPIEIDNAMFFHARGMGYMAKNNDYACRALLKILYDPNVQEAMLHAQRQHVASDASRQIANFVIENASKRSGK